MIGTQNRSQEPADNSLIMMGAVIVLAIILGGMVWFTWHAQISALAMRLMLWQSTFMPEDAACDRFRAQVQAYQAWPGNVRIAQLYAGFSIIGCDLRFVALPLALAVSIFSIAYSENRELRKVLDLEGLIEVQARMFPALRGFAKRRLTTLVNPGKTGDPLPADPALTPQEWQARYALDAQGRFSDIGASEAFQKQLGIWFNIGGARATPHAAQVMFAAFALHKLQQRGEAVTLLERLSSALADAGLDGDRGPAQPLQVPGAVLLSAQEILTQDVIFKTIAASCDNHGWSTTALMSLLCDARLSAGVLPPPAFAILKLIDRPLWYALHSLGFPSENPNEDVHPNPRIEAAGARAHWEEERRLGRPLYTPALARAVTFIRSVPTAQT